MAEITVPVSSLPLESEFVQDSYLPAWQIPHTYKWGRVIDHYNGSTLVELVENGRVVRANWAPEAPVIPVLPEDYDEDESPIQKENEMATTSNNPVEKNIRTRFAFQVEKLVKGKAAEQKTAAERLPKIIKEAAEKNVTLLSPEELGFPEAMDNEVFAGIEFGAAAEPAQTPAQADDAKQAERKSAVAAAKKEKVATKEAKPKREKRVIEPHDCLCGCGQTLTKDGKFAPGHDAKLKSLILKIERGEGTPGDIPEVSVDLVKFKKGELIKGDKDKPAVQKWVCTDSPVKLPGR